jgi:glucose-1-phosphate thymidylyltransferase
MKGIILAGGSGTRLHPITKVTSKQLLPIYNKPMIYYPIETLINSGIKDILFIIAPENAGDFLKLLGSGKEWGCKFSYEIQDKPEGIAQAYLIGENFIGDDNVSLILGDNIFEDSFSQEIIDFKKGALVFAKEVEDPKRFGVIEFEEKNKKVISLEEKPQNPKSNFAQVGLYVTDNTVIKKAKNLKFSQRKELEIVDIIKQYLKEENLKVKEIKGKWFDTGTHESMFKASSYLRKKILNI